MIGEGRYAFDMAIRLILQTLDALFPCERLEASRKGTRKREFGPTANQTLRIFSVSGNAKAIPFVPCPGTPRAAMVSPIEASRTSLGLILRPGALRTRDQAMKIEDTKFGVITIDGKT
jgi:hypothetical protein